MNVSAYPVSLTTLFSSLPSFIHPVFFSILLLFFLNILSSLFVCPCFLAFFRSFFFFFLNSTVSFIFIIIYFYYHVCPQNGPPRRPTILPPPLSPLFMQTLTSPMEVKSRFWVRLGGVISTISYSQLFVLCLNPSSCIVSVCLLHTYII